MFFRPLTVMKLVRYAVVPGIAVCIAVAVGVYAYRKNPEPDYVRGKYGKFCYETNHAPKNIKYFIYFNSREECLKSIGQ